MAGKSSQPLPPEEVLRTFNGRIFDAIQSPQTLAEFMYSEHLLGDEVINDLPSMKISEKKSALLSSVRAVVKGSERKEHVLTSFLMCLEQTGEHALQELASEMKTLCHAG